MIYKFDQLKDRIPFLKSKKIKKNKLQHYGQIKLLFSEILFLSKCASDHDKVLYVGAASGYHIALLADLFPFLTFDLWDPGRFNIESRKNITIYNKFFNNSDAVNYSKQKNILFY